MSEKKLSRLWFFFWLKKSTKGKTIEHESHKQVVMNVEKVALENWVCSVGRDRVLKRGNRSTEREIQEERGKKERKRK